MHLAYDLAVSLLGIYPREVLAHVYQETSGKMFIAVFFIKLEKARNNPSDHWQ